VRDFLDVRDVARAYHLLFQKGKAGEVYNVCRGQGISLREVINYIADYLKVEIDFKVDLLLVRPNDNPVVVGNNKKIVNETGWSPEISFKKSITDVCDYWMKIL
jgi:GDP-4-dehydro-6-deoxy-D-mannose reductase